MHVCETKQFCEMSSMSELDTTKNEAILQDWKVECRAYGLVPMRSVIVPLHLSNALRLPRKSEARSYEVLHLWRKIILANLKIWCSKMIQNATLLRTSAPWPPNTSDEDVCCTAPATRAASLQIFFKRPTPAVVFGSAAKPACLAHFSQGAESMAPATRNCPKFKKWSETVSF